MTQITKEAIETLEAARAHILDAYRIWQADDVSAVPPPKSGAGAVIAKIDAVLSSPIAGEGKVEPAQPDYGYMRVVEVFDRNVTAGAFLSEDGEGGFAAGVSRMADEIDRLRSALTSSPGKDGGQEVEAVGCPGDKCEHFWEEAPCCNGWRPQPASTALVERLKERGQAFANQVRLITHLLHGQAYSTTVAELNAFDAALSASQSTSKEGER